jgi:hypothetical protein
MPKYLTNSKYFDDGAGTHIENGFIQCLDLFINQISVEDLIQASADLIEIEINALQTQVNGLISTFTLTGTYYDGTLNALFVSLSDLRIKKTLYLYDASGNNPFSLNAYLISNTSNITSINTKLTNCSYNASLNAFQIGGNTDLRVLNTIYYYTNGVPNSLNQFISNTNTDLNTAITKTTNISYGSNTTTIGGNLIINNIDGFSKAHFDNAINFTYDLTSNAQTQIDGAYAAAAAAAASGGAAAAAALAAANANTTAAILVVTTAQSGVNTGFSTDITALQNKTATMSYDVNNNVVNFASKLTASSFGGITVNGGITQTGSGAIENTLIHTTNFLNWLNMKNGFGIDIQDNGALSVSGIATVGGNFTCSGAQANINATTTQIGTSTASTLNVYSNANHFGNLKIRNNSTTASGLIPPYQQVVSIGTNSNARKLQGIQIGVENLINNEANANIGYNYVSDGSTSNYLYLGLNPQTFNVIEGLRLYPNKCQISNGDLEILNSVNVNTINNYNSNLVLNSSSTNNIQLNSNIINIGTNQSTLAINTITIGSIASASLINLNGIVSTPYGITMTGASSIFSQF